MNNIYFSLSNQKSEEMKNSLLKDAIDSAKIKADIAASAAGLKVIGVKSIIVGEAGSSPPVPVYSAKALEGAGSITHTNNIWTTGNLCKCKHCLSYRIDNPFPLFEHNIKDENNFNWGGNTV